LYIYYSLTFFTFQEEVYDTIAESLKAEGRIVQKRQKGGDLKFQVLPLKEETKESSEG
jgi:hypothetical protein